MDIPPPPGSPEGMSAPPPGYRPYGALTPAPNSGMAIASLVLSLVGLVPIFWALQLPGLLGVIFGFVSRKQTRSGERRGAGLATAGIVLGFVMIAVSIWFWIWMVVSLKCEWNGNTWQCTNLNS